MKKIIFSLFLLLTCFTFSNRIFDEINGKMFKCSSLSDHRFIYLKILNKDNGYKALYSTAGASSTDLKKGKVTVESFELDVDIDEQNSFIYFKNLEGNAEYLSNYKVFYKHDKKGKLKLSLFNISKNRDVCDF